MKTLDKNSDEFKKKRSLFYSIAERNSFRIECGMLIKGKEKVKFTTPELLEYLNGILRDMNSFCTLPDGHKEYQNIVNDNIEKELERWYEILNCTFDKKFIKSF